MNDYALEKLEQTTTALAQALATVEQIRRESFMAGYEAAEQDVTVCQKPPHGWHCTRKAGHEGPCAAVETDDAALVQRGMDRLRDAQQKPATPDVPETNFGNTTEPVARVELMQTGGNSGQAPSVAFQYRREQVTKQMAGVYLAFGADLGARDPGRRPTAWDSPDGYWIRHSDKQLRLDSERFTEAFYTSPQVPEVPEGFALVKSPITEAMHTAACKVLTRSTGLDGLPQRMLDAMIDAARKGE